MNRNATYKLCVQTIRHTYLHSLEKDEKVVSCTKYNILSMFLICVLMLASVHYVITSKRVELKRVKPPKLALLSTIVCMLYLTIVLLFRFVVQFCVLAVFMSATTTLPPPLSVSPCLCLSLSLSLPPSLSHFLSLSLFLSLSSPRPPLSLSLFTLPPPPSLPPDLPH